MPNGYSLNELAIGEWNRLTEPLMDLDVILKAFAKSKELKLIENERNEPGRAIRWQGQFGYLISIGPDTFVKGKEQTWGLWIVAYTDRDYRWLFCFMKTQRYVKRQRVNDYSTIAVLTVELQELLDRAWTTINEWSFGDLNKAVTISTRLDIRGSRQN